MDFNTSGSLSIQTISVQYLTISGLVRIDLKTGEIEYLNGYKPNEAAQAFWDAVGRTCPGVKQQ